MKVVLDVSRLLAVTDLEALLEHIAEATATLVDAEQARVYLHDAVTSELWSPRPTGPSRLPASVGILATALGSPQPVSVADASADPVLRGIAAASGLEGRHALLAALRDVDLEPIGVVLVFDRRQGPFTADDAVLLELLGAQAAIAVQRFRLRQAAVQAEGLRHEMELAQRVQAALVPTGPQVDGIDAVGWTRAASITGGDCFDLWSLEGGRLAVFLGDASGHGLAAALVIAQVRTLLRALSEIQAEPDWLLSRVNARLAQDLDEGRFVTAFLACIASNGEVHWSSAGQGPVFIRRSAAAPFEGLQAPAVPLGVAPELMADAAAPLKLDEGGMIVVASDGVLEARNPQHEMFGPARLLQFLDAETEAPAQAVAQALAATLDDWTEGAEPLDDQTVLVIRKG